MTTSWRAESTPILVRWGRPAPPLDIVVTFRDCYRVEALDALPLAPLTTPEATPITLLASCLGRLLSLPLTLAHALWCRYQASARGRQAVEVEERLRALAFLVAAANRRGHWAAWAEVEERMAGERRYWAFLRRSQREWRRRG